MLTRAVCGGRINQPGRAYHLLHHLRRVCGLVIGGVAEVNTVCRIMVSNSSNFKGTVVARRW